MREKNTTLLRDIQRTPLDQEEQDTHKGNLPMRAGLASGTSNDSGESVL